MVEIRLDTLKVLNPDTGLYEPLASLQGRNAFIRYSAYEDGTDFTEEWTAGQRYMGTMTGFSASANKEDYTWSQIYSETDLSNYATKDELNELQVPTTRVTHGDATTLLSSIIDTYILDLDYKTLFGFDIEELVVGNSATTTATLGKAILGSMVLGQS